MDRMTQSLRAEKGKAWKAEQFPSSFLPIQWTLWAGPISHLETPELLPPPQFAKESQFGSSA